MAKPELVDREAMGIPADWLNAWLAALGVTVLLPEVKLSWTNEVVQHAVFWTPPTMDLGQAVFAAMPTAQALAGSPIAPDGPGGTLGQKVNDIALYNARAALARQQRSDALSSSLTDLAHEDVKGPSPTPVARGQFCVGMEGSETLWKRLAKCVSAIHELDDPPLAISLSLNGSPRRARVKANGLGFDPRRLPSGVTDAGATIDPVVEVLAYLGTQILPVRGAGHKMSQAAQKPWLRGPDGRDRLQYPVWAPPLDCWAIDAFLDWFLDRGHQGVSDVSLGTYQVRRLVPQSGTKKAAYFSEAVL